MNTHTHSPRATALARPLVPLLTILACTIALAAETELGRAIQDYYAPRTPCHTAPSWLPLTPPPGTAVPGVYFMEEWLAARYPIGDA